MIEERIMDGSAHRNGIVVCSHVRALVRDGLRRQLRLRFLDGIAPTLRDDLDRLLHARGIRGAVIVDRIAPIDLELHSPRGLERFVGCQLGLPVQRYMPLEQIDFRARAVDHVARGVAQGSPGGVHG